MVNVKILAAVIIIGAVILISIPMWRLGVFSSSGPRESIGFDTFSVGTNYKITSDGTATLLIENADKQSRTITLNEVTVDSKDCTGDTGTKDAGEFWTITCTGLGSNSIGTSYIGIEVVVKYTVDGSAHTETGKISGRYE